MQHVEKGLASFKEQALGLMSSVLAECMKEDAAFLSGILEACTSSKREVCSCPPDSQTLRRKGLTLRNNTAYSWAASTLVRSCAHALTGRPHQAGGA